MKYLIKTIIISLILSLCGCSTIRNSINDYKDEYVTNYDDLVKISNERFANMQNISGKIALSLKVKKEEINSNAYISCNKNQAIKIIIMPFPFIEAGRIWINKEGIYIWDKINSVKIEETYPSISAQLGVNINYQLIESFLLGDIFTKNIPQKDNYITYCNKSIENNGYILEGNSFDIVYKFLLNKSALPTSVELFHKGNLKNKIQTNTDGYQYINQQFIIPTKQNIYISKNNTNIFNLSIKYISIKANTDTVLDTEVKIPNNITKIGLKDISKFFKY